ncbi:TPA: hypothetical protein ACHG40_002684 [Escherichia coli]
MIANADRRTDKAFTLIR